MIKAIKDWYRIKTAPKAFTFHCKEARGVRLGILRGTDEKGRAVTLVANKRDHRMAKVLDHCHKGSKLTVKSSTPRDVRDGALVYSAHVFELDID